MNSAVLYETDFYAWATQQAQWLRENKLDALDMEHLAEEMENVGLSEKRQLQHRLEVLVAHLLKLGYLDRWKEDNERVWKLTVKEQRRRIVLCLQDNPSLKSHLPKYLAEIYPSAVYQIILPYKLNETDFPAICPYTLEQILDNDFLP